MNYEILGQRLRVARERAGMTQTEAAQFIDVTSAALNQYESGKRRVDALSLERLARLYGVPLRFLFGEETVKSDWEEALRLCSKTISASGKAGIGRLIEKVYALEELYKQTDTPFPELPHPPFASLTDSLLKEDGTAVLAAQRARSHYNLGIAPLGDLKSFLQAQGLLVFAIPFGKEENAISGLFFLHPQLGQIIAINQDNADTCRSFILAQGLAYSLYLHDRSATVYRQGDKNYSQIFAERFACYFMIPSEALQERLHALKVKVVSHPIEVVHLSRYFGVSYETMLYRLEQENKITGSQVNLKNVQAAVLARHLGYSPSHYELQQRFPSIEERLPRIFIELAYRAVEEDKLSLRRVAEMLGISDIELEERLYFEDTEDDESEEEGSLVEEEQKLNFITSHL
ncbi:helix-turn-helix domain-containing protein [Planktothrix sp. FACHB-1355]|uniref:Helix-turn-helix domain-containing protein n=1 Tax=Aerosakkonema funiforme FACHB-1375 TaxID=2949571 RepID=A0A926VFF4_9CYAN|nr:MULTISPECIES: XRE family transcriptional regulator [Oscillatoriales]MBD2182792.1 helix-turn-helix domain-containing protein [Aerosakkonema funiforme FACHB-1375]MBD3560369.1 helix-turn-helix domain-containing protein [Planktothrix sp. FACHB-1355]